MAIPLQVQLVWRTLGKLAGPSLLQLPADEVRAASDRRRKLATLPGARAIFGRTHPGVHITEKFAVAGDGARLPVRVYRRAGDLDVRLPLIMNFHGGGFVSGDPRQSDWWASSIAHEVGAVVVSVDYRLAPEHQYPTAAEDCYAATEWAVRHSADLGADGTRVAVMGDSAGGNLAAVVCLMARDRGGPPIALQVLIYPVVDFVGTYPSEDENEFTPILAKADLHGDAMYCPGREHEPYASPLFAAHGGLPPALIQTAHHDPLRDQGSAYAAALRAAGVRAQLRDYVDAVHGYISVPGLVPAARQALADAAAELRAVLTDRPDFQEDNALE